MGTEVLRPQDFWADRFRLSAPPAVFHRRKSYYPNTRHHRRPSVPRAERPDQRRKSPSPSPSPSTSPSPSPPPTPQPQQRREPINPSAPVPIPTPRRSPSADELQAHYNHQQHHHQYQRFGAPTHVGRVRILRRGQSLDTIDANRMKRDIARGGLIKKKYLDEDDVYSGSAFFASPSPSSLPLPSFFNNNSNSSNNHQKKIINTTMGNDEIHDSATRDLRRLLRLD